MIGRLAWGHPDVGKANETHGQTCVWEDEGVPGQSELETSMSDTRPVRTAGDNEEEDGKTPEPDAHPIRHHD